MGRDEISPHVPQTSSRPPSHAESRESRLNSKGHSNTVPQPRTPFRGDVYISHLLPLPHAVQREPGLSLQLGTRVRLAHVAMRCEASLQGVERARDGEVEEGRGRRGEEVEEESRRSGSGEEASRRAAQGHPALNF